MKTDDNASAISRILHAEKFPWSLYVACTALTVKLKSKLAGLLLNASNIHLGPGCVVRGSAFIDFGRDIYVHGHLWLEAVVAYRTQQFVPRIEIGDSVSFSEGVHITCIERISIQKGVLFGSHVYLSDHNHGTYRGAEPSDPEEPPSDRALGGGGPVEIGENVWLGQNVVVVGPVKIGRGAIIAANAVVRCDVPAFTMVGGIPAKPLRRFDMETNRWIKVGEIHEVGRPEPSSTNE